MSESQEAAASAVVTLETWFTGLSAEAQTVIAPVLVEGILTAIEGVSGEVDGYGQTTVSPRLLRGLGPQRAPTITWLVGLTDWIGNAPPPAALAGPTAATLSSRYPSRRVPGGMGPGMRAGATPSTSDAQGDGS